MRKFILLLCFLLCASITWGDHSTLRQDTFNTLPDSNLSTFRTNSMIFWDHESSQREGHYLSPFVYSGGLHTTSVSLTSAAFATEAFVPEHILQVSTAITYPASTNDRCITIISSDNNGIAGWTRTGTTAYYTKCQGSTTENYNPTLPPNSTPLMSLVIASNAITVVNDIRRLTPINILNNLSIASLKDYGCRGNGVNDDSLCLSLALASGKTIIAPEGTYYIPTAATKTGGTVNMLGMGTGKTIFLAKTATIPSCVAGGNSLTYSYTILSITSATQVTLRDITFDGGKTTGPYCNNGTYLDQHSLIEIRTSANILFDHVETTKYAGSQAALSAGGTMDPAGLTFSQNFGPVYIDQSSNINILHSRSSSPSFNDGWFITESHDVLVDGFYSNAGRLDHVQYGQASPILVFGITDSAYNVKIINSTFINNNGSVGVYVTKGVQLLNNSFENGTGFILWDSFFGYPSLPPNGVPAGTIPIIDNVIISNNIWYDMLSACISLGKSAVPGTIRATNVIISDNVCRKAPVGFLLGDTSGLQILNNRLYEITQYTAGAGRAISITDANRVRLANNTLDGSTSVANGVGYCALGADCQTIRNIEIGNCNVCEIDNNEITDAVSNNIYIYATLDNTYSNLSVTNNRIMNTVYATTLPISAGADITHRYKTAYVSGNIITDSIQSGNEAGNNTAVYATNPLADLNTIQAYRTANTTGLTATPAAIPWDTEEYNTWKSSAGTVAPAQILLNTTTGLFTMPTGRRGFQVLTGAVTITNLANTKSLLCFLYVGGVSKKKLLQYTNGAGGVSSPTLPFSVKVWMDLNTTFDLRCSSDDPANPVIAGGADKTYVTLQFAGAY